MTIAVINLMLIILNLLCVLITKNAHSFLGWVSAAIFCILYYAEKLA